MLAAIRDHLRSVLPSARWAGVEVAEDIDALGDRAGQVDSGTAIVMPWREAATPNALASGGFRQEVTVEFVVAIVLREYDPLMGGDRAGGFDLRKADLEAALAGWEPPGFETGCELVAGEGSPITKGVSVFAQTWTATRFLTGA